MSLVAYEILLIC